MALRDTSPYAGETGRGTVAGLFRDYGKAERAISDLKAAGFSESQIGIAQSEDLGTSGTQTADLEQHDRGLWDKIKSAFGSHEREEEANYAYSDDFHGSLTGAGIPEDRARYFGSNMESGGCLVTVNTSGGRASDAIAILERNGADIGSGAVDFGQQKEPPSRGLSGERRIQLLGEMLRVHKERVSRGEVRIRKEVVRETKNIEVPVTREELVIEHSTVSGEQPVAGEIGSEKEIRVPLSEERVRVEKQPVVTGEVRVGKREVQDTKTISDQVRHEEVKLDKEGDVDIEDTKLKNKDKRIA